MSLISNHIQMALEEASERPTMYADRGREGGGVLGLQDLS